MADSKPTPAEDQTAKMLSVPLNDDGTIGTLPDPLQKLMDQRISQAIARAKEKVPPPDPVERERLRQLEDEVQRHRIAEAEREKKYEEALGMREQSWKERETALKAELDRRTQRLTDSLLADLRAAALQHGARPDAVDDLALTLKARVTLDEQLRPTILDGDGKPVPDGTVEALVKTTLDAKPFYRAGPAPGGGARGGAYLSSGGVLATPEAAAVAEAERRVVGGDRSPDAINQLFEANRALKARKAG